MKTTRDELVKEYAQLKNEFFIKAKKLAKAYIAGVVFLLLNIVWCCVIAVLIPTLIFSDGDNCALNWGDSLTDKLRDWVNKD